MTPGKLEDWHPLILGALERAARAVNQEHPDWTLEQIEGRARTWLKGLLENYHAAPKSNPLPGIWGEVPRRDFPSLDAYLDGLIVAAVNRECAMIERAIEKLRQRVAKLEEERGG